MSKLTGNGLRAGLSRTVEEFSAKCRGWRLDGGDSSHTMRIQPPQAVFQISRSSKKHPGRHPPSTVVDALTPNQRMFRPIYQQQMHVISHVIKGQLQMCEMTVPVTLPHDQTAEMRYEVTGVTCEMQ